MTFSVNEILLDYYEMDGLIIIQFRRATCYFYGISKCDYWYVLPVYQTIKTKIKIGIKYAIWKILFIFLITKFGQNLEKRGVVL